MSSYPYLYTQTYSYTPFFSLVMPVLALLVIVAGGLALYFLFVRKPNTYKGPAASLHDILTFRTFFTEKLIRVLYCIAAVAIAVYSVMLLFSHFFAALFAAKRKNPPGSGGILLTEISEKGQQRSFLQPQERVWG